MCLRHGLNQGPSSYYFEIFVLKSGSLVVNFEKLNVEKYLLPAPVERFLFADSTNSEHFATPMGVLVETIYGNSSKTMLLPGSVTAFVPTQPLAMTMLDSLTIHAKMRSDMLVYCM